VDNVRSLTPGLVLRRDDGTTLTVCSGVLDVPTKTLTVTHLMYEFDGTENWVVSGSDTSKYFRHSLGENLHATTGTTGKKCSHYVAATINNSTTTVGWTAMTSSEITVLAFRPDLTKISSKDEWLLFLAEQEAAGTPVQCMFPIAADYRPEIQLTESEMKRIFKD